MTMAGGAPTTGTSATAACTSGSTSTWSPRPASPVSGASSRRPPTWSPRTGVPCPASTATARPVRRCVGVGACLSASGNVMCPSYRATGEEQHSTRGRARLLFEFASGRAGVDAAHADDVAGALDLCLSCKGCKRDCPVGVDMAAYKAEFLAQRYAGRRRPATHYSLGWLPQWLRLVSRTRSAALLNRAAKVPVLTTLAKRLGGLAPERDIPVLAGESFQAWFARRGPRAAPAASSASSASSAEAGPRVLLWP